MEEMTVEERQAALNEVKVLDMLDHPNIIAYYDSFVEDKALMIVMEYAEGGTIFDFLQVCACRGWQTIASEFGKGHSPPCSLSLRCSPSFDHTVMLSGACGLQAFRYKVHSPRSLESLRIGVWRIGGCGA